MKLVVVESPAKAKTIGQYLGTGYNVVASMGHVRDLPSKTGAIDTEHGFAMKYQIKSESSKYVDRIVAQARKSDAVYLASDPDREGEAIAWNIYEILRDKNVIPADGVKRMSFNEITKSAIKDAIKNTRDIDSNLVHAQQTRLTLDYLVGFSISPILWRKLPGSKSAGRVQSVALRLIGEREIEIKAFISREYWSIIAILKLQRDNIDLTVNIIKYLDKKVDNTFPSSKELAEEIEEKIKSNGAMLVIDIEKKDINQHPTPPFTTALLQQEASRKIGLSSSVTMKMAQKLYEGVSIDGETTGLITYMRTDGMSMSSDAVSSIRKYIDANFGEKYLPNKPRIYKTKAKNAQEAHEAIRPTDINITPEVAKKYLDGAMYKLYALIWTRTVACQMESAIKSSQSITFQTPDNNVTGKIVGSRIKFDGFLRIYNNADNIERSSSDDDNKEENILPAMEIGNKLDVIDTNIKQHFTNPPPRFTEATLIKKMEELGIGRPSTYATIITVLQDRGYVRLDKRQFFTEHRGILVVAFLKQFFQKYVEYDFTAKLEDELDLISDGKLSRISCLEKFWSEFDENVTKVGSISGQDVSLKLSSELGGYLFNKDDNGDLMNLCPLCNSGKLLIGVGKYGPFIKCSGYPECKYIGKFDNIMSDTDVSNIESQEENQVTLENGDIASVKDGKYGRYIEVISQSGEKRNISVPKDADLSVVDNILQYGSLPRKLGKHPDTGNDVTLGMSRYGMYINHDGKYYPVRGDHNLASIDLAKALDLMKDGGKSGDRKQKSTSPTITLAHPKTKEVIKVGKSRYGVYALYKKKFHSIKGVDNIEDVTLDLALDSISG